MDKVELKMKLMPLSSDQREMIEELEQRPDHVESIEKAGIEEGRVFSMLFFEDDKRVQCAIVRHDGNITWETRPKIPNWNLPPLKENADG